MKCANVRELAVLIPSGDLSAADVPRVARHLESCADCRDFAASAPLSLSALRTAPPLRDSDYAAIRARVLGDLGPARRPLPFRRAALFASAAALIIALLGVVMTSTSRPVTVFPVAAPSTVVEAPRQTAAPAPPPSLVVAVEDSVAIEKPLAIESAAVAQSEAVVPAPRPASARPHSSLSTHTTLAELEESSELRIQIQTGDPDVRIIWIVNPTVELDMLTLEEES